MRPIPIILVLLATPLALAIAPIPDATPGQRIVAVGEVQYIPDPHGGGGGYDGEGRDPCLPGDIDAALFIERGDTSDEEWVLTGSGTALLSAVCGSLFVYMSGGQCFECTGSCQIFENGTAECWYGWNGDANGPSPHGGNGYYLRLDHDGRFIYWYNYDIPFITDFKLVGTLPRVV